MKQQRSFDPVLVVVVIAIVAMFAAIAFYTPNPFSPPIRPAAKIGHR